MWYFLIFCGIVVLIVSYRAASSSRPPKGPTKSLAHPTASTAIACCVMAVVLGMTHLSSAPRSDLREQRLEVELDYRHALGFVIANETINLVKDPEGLTIVGLDHNDPGRKKYQEAIIAGIEKAAGDLPVEKRLVPLVIPEDADLERLYTGHLRVGISDLEAALREFDKNNVIICLSNIPADYAGSALATRIANSLIKIGFVVDDVYSLGDEIFTGKVSVCASPQRTLSYALPVEPLPQDPIALFQKRYFLLNKDNIEKFALENRSMMRIERAN